MLKKLIITACSIILAACSVLDTTQTPTATGSWEAHQLALKDLHSWDISGKIGIVTADNSNSASLKWLQEQQNYHIDIRGPLGQGGASIQGTKNHVTVNIAGEGIFEGPNPEYILFQQLGWDLPISDIYWWIRGLPSPDSSFQHSLEHNRLKILQQNGWTIQYLRYNSLNPALPRKLKLVRNGLKITLIVNSWIAL
ncbi:MAG: lipoprotein insertase outer membrane protein LolB [Neptuniibacter sp.]